jgi:hypothetical protein
MDLLTQPGQLRVQKIFIPEVRLVIIDQPGGRIFIGREFSSFEDALNEVRLQMGYPAQQIDVDGSKRGGSNAI